MDNKDFFEELNNELKLKGLTLECTIVGGAVLDHHGIRATHDIDAFYNTSGEIEDIINKVGNKFKINSKEENWLNNSVSNLNKKPPGSICNVLYEFSNLRVLIPPLTYIAGMKFLSGRQQDIEDVAQIIKKENIVSPDELEDKLLRYKQPEFKTIDESLILESFGIAYGMKC